MRNQSLQAYSLHQRPFQEKRSIYYLFTKEWGVLHGIAPKGIPQFVPLTLFATGKKPLKTLQQVTIADTVPRLQGQQQYAALYLNEITLKLLPLEDSVPLIYQQYAQAIGALQFSLSATELKLVLRLYEQVLFTELGYAIDLQQDDTQNPIEPKRYYHFGANRGWYPKPPLNEQTACHAKRKAQIDKTGLLGSDIIAMRRGIHPTTLSSWSLIHRQLIDHLFDYQPLQSRILWQQFMHYQ